MPFDLILGTAGHIDHGKTALVKALTGVDTDRLPEEKRRGITIELGFAELNLGEYRLGIVDVPGHERFVRNMLAGAMGVDLALLVIAADDSVKPQTREHLEILRLLDLPSGVIALSKCDLVDEDWLELVREEVRELVAGTFLAEAPLVPTSVRTGAGLDDLRAALAMAAARAAGARRRSASDPFRLAIDRSFTVAGHGTVVTGSVSTGTARVGDELEIQPLGQRVRIRGLQNHDRPVEEVHLGQRAAINLAGVHHDQVGRGQELASPGHLVPAKVLSVRLHLAEEADRPLKDRTRVHLHLGTAEVMASVRLLDGDRLAPGESVLAQLFLNRPVVATWGQGFVIRSESPVFTMGGGRVLDPQALTLRRSQAAGIAELAALEMPDASRRAAAALYLLGLRPWQPANLVRLAGVSQPRAVVDELAAAGTLVELSLSPTQRVRVHRRALDELGDRVIAVLGKLHAHEPLSRWIPRSTLKQRVDYLGSERLIEAGLEHFVAQGRLEASPQGLSLAGHQVTLGPGERQLYDQLMLRLGEAAFQPPSPAELATALRRTPDQVQALLRLAVAQGDAVEIGPDFFLHGGQREQIRARLTPGLAAGSGLTVSEIRELLATSRKYAVPLCEYLDRTGFTRRDGDRRVLAVPG